MGTEPNTASKSETELTEPELRQLLAEAQFTIARLLWDPREDQHRAYQLASLAARTHPDGAVRKVIASWIRGRIAPKLEGLAPAPRSAGVATVIAARSA